MTSEPTNFASEQAPTQPTELERVQQRIANYKIGINPNSAQAVSTLLQLHLKSGLIKLEELETVVAVRDEIQKGLTDYNMSVETAQRQLNELIEADRVAKQQLIEEEKAQLTDKIRDQRKQRKDAELKVAQLEAILASHGIQMDLNNDGVIGVKEGSLNQDGFVELSAEEAATLAQQHGVTIPETKIQKGTIDETPKKTSKAFAMARLLNPEESTEETVQDEPSYIPQSETTYTNPVATPQEEFEQKIADTKQAFEEWEDQTETEVEDEEMVFGNESTEDDGFDLPVEEGYDANGSPVSEFPTETTIEIEVPEDANNNIEDFYAEVDKAVDEMVQDDIDEKQFNESFEEHTEVSRRERVLLDPLEASQRSDELKIAEEDTKTEPTYAKPSSVPITSTNMPRQTLKSGDSIEAEVQEEKKINTYDSEEEMLEAVQQKIDTAIEQEQEEEFEELVIPSAEELKGMTKSKIKEVAESLNFEVSTTDTKDTMIESIATQTESLIESLQESDEFVSATETVKGEEDDDRRDGGYF